MESINEKVLKDNLKDPSQNKVKMAKECDVTMSQLFKSKINLFYYAKNHMRVYELSQWVISFNNYLKRKSGNFYKNFKQGDEIVVDFGFAYGDELAYKHHCIVLAQKKSKIFILPLSSNTSKLLDDKGKQQPEFCVAGVNEGFTKDVLILLNDARWISTNRVLTNAINQIEKDYLNELKLMLLQRGFGDLYNHLQHLESQKKKFVTFQENSAKREQDLKNEIKELKSQIKDSLIKPKQTN